MIIVSPFLRLLQGETTFTCNDCGLRFKNPYKRIMNPLFGGCIDPAPRKPIPFWIKQYAIKECPQCKSENITNRNTKAKIIY